jgi:hypothetical protein
VQGVEFLRKPFECLPQPHFREVEDAVRGMVRIQIGGDRVRGSLKQKSDGRGQIANNIHPADEGLDSLTGSDIVDLRAVFDQQDVFPGRNHMLTLRNNVIVSAFIVTPFTSKYGGPKLLDSTELECPRIVQKPDWDFGL